MWELQRTNGHHHHQLLSFISFPLFLLFHKPKPHQNSLLLLLPPTHINSFIFHNKKTPNSLFIFSMIIAHNSQHSFTLLLSTQHKNTIFFCENTHKQHDTRSHKSETCLTDPFDKLKKKKKQKHGFRFLLKHPSWLLYANIKQNFPTWWWCFPVRWSSEQDHPNMIFLGGFCREYEGEYFYDGNLSKNNLWWTRSNNKYGVWKLRKYLQSKNKFKDEI